MSKHIKQKKEDVLQFKIRTEQGIEEVSRILNEKYLELLELMFPDWFRKFEDIESKILKNNVTRVQINFGWRLRKKYSKFEINLKISKFCLLFSLKTNKMLENVFEEDFDNIMFAGYLNSLGIIAKVVPISESSRPREGVCGKEHNSSKHESNGFGKLPKSKKPCFSKLFSKKQRKAMERAGRKDDEAMQSCL